MPEMAEMESRVMQDFVRALQKSAHFCLLGCDNEMGNGMLKLPHLWLLGAVELEKSKTFCDSGSFGSVMAVKQLKDAIVWPDVGFNIIFEDFVKNNRFGFASVVTCQPTEYPVWTRSKTDPKQTFLYQFDEKSCSEFSKAKFAESRLLNEKFLKDHGHLTMDECRKVFLEWRKQQLVRESGYVCKVFRNFSMEECMKEAAFQFVCNRAMPEFVPALLGFYEYEEGKYSILSERVYGWKLGDIWNNAPMEVQRTIFAQLCLFLAFKSLLLIDHGDLSSENVMIDGRTGSVRVVDFGLSKVSGTNPPVPKNPYAANLARRNDGLFLQTLYKTMDQQDEKINLLLSKQFFTSTDWLILVKLCGVARSEMIRLFQGITLGPFKDLVQEVGSSLVPLQAMNEKFLSFDGVGHKGFVRGTLIRYYDMAVFMVALLPCPDVQVLHMTMFGFVMPIPLRLSFELLMYALKLGGRNLVPFGKENVLLGLWDRVNTCRELVRDEDLASAGQSHFDLYNLGHVFGNIDRSWFLWELLEFLLLFGTVSFAMIRTNSLMIKCACRVVAKEGENVSFFICSLQRQGSLQWKYVDTSDMIRYVMEEVWKDLPFCRE